MVYPLLRRESGGERKRRVVSDLSTCVDCKCKHQHGVVVVQWNIKLLSLAVGTSHDFDWNGTVLDLV